MKNNTRYFTKTLLATAVLSLGLATAGTASASVRVN